MVGLFRWPAFPASLVSRRVPKVAFDGHQLNLWVRLEFSSQFCSGTTHILASGTSPVITGCFVRKASCPKRPECVTQQSKNSCKDPDHFGCLCLVGRTGLGEAGVGQVVPVACKVTGQHGTILRETSCLAAWVIMSWPGQPSRYEEVSG